MVPLAKLPRLPDALTAAALVPLGAVVGAALVALAAPFGGAAPLAVVGVVALPAVALAVVARPLVAVAVVMAVVPFGARDLPGSPVQLIMLAVLGVAVLVGLRLIRDEASPAAWAAPLGWGAALLAWSVVSFPSAVDHGLAVRQVVQLGIGILSALVVVTTCRGADDVRRALAPAVLVAAAVCAYSATFAGAQRGRFGGAVVTGRAQGTFAQPNELGMYAAAIGVVAIAFALAARTRRAQLLWGAASLAVMTGLALSLSRGAWIGFLAGLLALIVLVRRARRLLIGLVAVVAPLGLALGAYVPTNPQVEVIGARIRSIAGERNPYDDRPAIWAEARREVLADPLTGFGPGSFPVASVRSTSEARSTYAVHAHNLVLTWAAETGVPGAAFLIGLAVHVGGRLKRWRTTQRPDSSRSIIAAGLAGALVAVLGQGLVDYPLRNSSLFVLTWGLLGALLAATRPTPAQALAA